MGSSESKGSGAGYGGCCGGLYNEEQFLTESGPAGCTTPGFPCNGDLDDMNMPLCLGLGDFGVLSRGSLQEDMEVCPESSAKLKRRLANIAEAAFPDDAQLARAHSDVLCRVLDVLVSTASSQSSASAPDLGDSSALMVVVASQEQLDELVCTPEILVLTKEPAATSVHDGRFARTMSKLCRGCTSASSRRESSGRHVAVSHTSGEITATSALFMQKGLKHMGGQGLMGMASPDMQQDAWAEEQIDNLPMGPLEVAAFLTKGVVFAVYEPGGVVVLPSVDVLRGRCFRVTRPI